MLPKAVGEHSLLERNVSDAVLITVKTLIVVPVVSIPAIKCDFAFRGVIYNIINVSFDDVVFKDASVKRSVKVKGYGIKFNSNFQWSTTTRDVKDGKAESMTREPEMVKAFRDTWRYGIN